MSAKKTFWTLFTAATLLLFVVFIPEFYKWSLEDHKKQSRANLKQIGVALHAYHEQYESFPPAYVLGPDGKPWHSWRVLLLPFLNQNQLYEAYRWDEPWDGPNNRKLHSRSPDVYSSPRQQKRGGGITMYMAIISRRTIWPAHFTASITDVTDGTSNTIQLVENPASNVIWMEPRDLREKEALDLLAPQKTDANRENRSPNVVLFADGSTRAISSTISRDLIVSLFTPRYRQVMVTDEKWTSEFLMDNDFGASSMPPIVDVEKLPGTKVVTTPDAHLDQEQSEVYCATVQLAWDQLRPGPGQSVFVQEVTPLFESLNSHPFPTASLSPEAYFAGIARLDEDENNKLHERFRSRFPDASAEALNVPRDLKEIWGGLRILTYLQKTMPFPEVLEQMVEPLRFHTIAVQSFGMSPSKDAKVPTAFDQTVHVASYTSDDEFVIILKTESRQRDQIVLAKVVPQDSLRTTWDNVFRQMQIASRSSEDSHLHTIDRLQIPELSFGLIATMRDLIDVRIPTEQESDRYVHDVRQTIRFRLDRHGAILESDTYLIVGDFDDPGHPPAPKPRNFVFDRPFLIALRELNAEQPYFLAWIGTVDFMRRLPIGDKN